MSELYKEMLDTGTLVAGHYNHLGQLVTDPDSAAAPKVAGESDDVIRLQNKYKQMILASGGELHPQLLPQAPKKKRGPKPKNKSVVKVRDVTKTIDPEYHKPYIDSAEDEEIPVTPPKNSIVYQQKVTFQNGLGKIKVEVEDVIIKDNVGLMLVFTNEDKVTFEPKTGENIEFSIDGDEFMTLFYPGTLFSYHNKQIMVLFIVPDSIEEEEE
jgi:hypothetical protein